MVVHVMINDMVHIVNKPKNDMVHIVHVPKIWHGIYIGVHIYTDFFKMRNYVNHLL